MTMTKTMAALALCAALLPTIPAAAAVVASAARPMGSVPVPVLQAVRYHRRYRPGGSHYYHVNRYGFGNYRRGAHGGFGGYPAGSAGAIELQNNHRIKCEAAPSRC